MQITSRFDLKIIFLAIVTTFFMGSAFAKWWAKPPVVEARNLTVLKLLTTSVSSRNFENFKKVEALIEEKIRLQEMSLSEARAFKPILDLATNQEWDKARKECHRLAEAQHNRTRVAVSENSHDHSHDHSHHHNE